MLNGYKKTIPDGVQLGVDNLTKFAAKTYLNQAQLAKITRWRGQLFGSLQKQSLKPRKYSRFSNYVSMPHYGVKLDRMPPHWVSFKRHPIIYEWAKKKLSLEARSIYLPIGKIYVRPHPFIAKSNQIIGQNVRRFIVKEINKKIKGKGR